MAFDVWFQLKPDDFKCYIFDLNGLIVLTIYIIFHIFSFYRRCVSIKPLNFMYSFNYFEHEHRSRLA